KGIENILLIEHREEAINFLTGRNVPGNVREAYIINGDHLYGGANFRYYSNFRRGVHYFVRNVTEEIRRRKSLLEICNNDIRNTNTHMTSIERNLDKIKEIQELQSFEVKASDLTALETELHDREEEIEKDKEELEKLEVSCRNVATKATTLEDQINDLENGIQKIVEDMKLLKEKRKEIEVKYRSYDSQWNELQSKIDQLYRKKNEKLQTTSNQENTVETSKEAAFKLSPTRCNSSLDISTLNKQIKAKKKRLSDHEKETGTREEILAAYGIAKKKYNEQSGHLTILDSTSKVIHFYTKDKDNLSMLMALSLLELREMAQQLNNQLKKRHKLFTGMQKILTQRIIDTFGKTLAKRGYLGTMLIDHNKKKISLDVKISANAKTSGTGSLSGGERSFSTVAFIVALWEATDSPLQCLDEFDVFMDMVNRDLCMDTLLQLATKRKRRQFIFLSPQNMSKLKFKENIRIHRLQDPARENNQPPITDSLVRQS
ncbi:Structural maintenance of chromosomes protein 6, partial [Trichoplax sp. H2]